MHSYLAQGSTQSYAFIDRCARAVGNALEIKLCKIPMIREQEPNSPPTSGSPIVFSAWALLKN
ncbi:hypothetical protein FIM76_06850 [Helicobacter pylori]|nr:hypothetical protein FIM76_06850 [Helicobacter pylori]